MVGGELVGVEVILMFRSENFWVNDELEIRQLRRGDFSTRLLRDEGGGLDVNARTGLERGGGKDTGEVVACDELICLDTG